MPSPEKEVATIEPWAAGIGLATLVLVASVAVFTAWDRAHTASLEEVAMPTAVGDLQCVQEPKGTKGPIGLKYQGKELDAVSEKKHQDARMIRIGSDDGGVYSIYRLEEEKESKNERLFMKGAENEFFEVRTE